VDALSVVLIFLGGCLAGFLAGFFGISAGIALVPVLLLFYQSVGVTSLVAIHLSIGTSLFVLLFGSLSSAYQYYRKGHIIWRAIVIIGIASVVSALGGSFIAGIMSSDMLRKVFAVAVAITGLAMFGELRKPKGEPKLEVPGLLGTGAVIGGITSLAAVGGGIFSVWLIYSVHRFPLMKALGISSATLAIAAAAAALGYIVSGQGNVFLPPGTLGYVDPLRALLLILGIIPLGVLGERVAQRTKAGVLRKVFAVFLLALAAKLFFV